MGSSSYIDGDGIKRHRSVQNTGTSGDPHVADVRDATVATGIGGQSDAIATSSASTASVIGLIKGLWSAFGLVSQAADATGTLLQRVRAIVDRMGSYGDAASATGSIMAQLRMIAESPSTPRTTNAQYYTSVAGGNKTYNTTTGVQSVNASGATVCLLNNPTGSGIDIYIQRIVLSSEAVGRYERYRGATFTATGAAETNNNRGGNGTPGLAKLYKSSSVSVSGNGALGVVTYVGTSNSFGDMVDGTLILRPGQNLHWRYIPTNASGSTNCSVEVVWWELTAQT